MNNEIDINQVSDDITNNEIEHYFILKDISEAFERLSILFSDLAEIK